MTYECDIFDQIFKDCLKDKDKRKNNDKHKDNNNKCKLKKSSTIIQKQDDKFKNQSSRPRLNTLSNSQVKKSDKLKLNKKVDTELNKFFRGLISDQTQKIKDEESQVIREKLESEMSQRGKVLSIKRQQQMDELSDRQIAQINFLKRF